jgi:hypothetical protein
MVTLMKQAGGAMFETEHRMKICQRRLICHHHFIALAIHPFIASFILQTPVVFILEIPIIGVITKIASFKSIILLAGLAMAAPTSPAEGVEL